jgi:hypothetical protein
LFLVLGINMAGEKEILGQWIAQTEGANFWGHFSPRCRSKGFFPRIQGRHGMPLSRLFWATLWWWGGIIFVTVYSLNCGP